MTENGWKMTEIVENWWKFVGNDFKLADLVGTSGKKWPKLMKNDQNLMKIQKMNENYWKMVEICDKWLQIGEFR